MSKVLIVVTTEAETRQGPKSVRLERPLGSNNVTISVIGSDAPTLTIPKSALLAVVNG